MDNTTNPQLNQISDYPKFLCSIFAMVVSLGPGKFYGTSLPRPRIYTDVKFNSDRVDPPVSVMDPFLSWAEEAHWSMGGLSFKRLRLQGRIEGNVGKLRKQREKQAKVRATHSPKAVLAPGRVRVNGKGAKKESLRYRSDSPSPSPPPAPKITKKRRFMDLFDEESEEEEEQSIAAVMEKKKKSARKLAGEFEKVANETPVGMRTRRRGLVESGNDGGGVTDSVMKIVEELNKENNPVEKKLKAGKKSKNGGENRSKSSPSPSPIKSVRISPRLAKKT